MPTWRESLSVFTQYYRSIGDIRKSPPATEDELDIFVTEAERKGYYISDDYLAFLRTTDGFDDFGLLIYATHVREQPSAPLGFFDINDELRFEHPQRTFYGDTGDTMFVYDHPTSQFWVQDRASADLLDPFTTLGALFDHIFGEIAVQIQTSLAEKQ